MIDFIVRELGLQKDIAAKVIMRCCTAAAAVIALHLSGHFGITVNQGELAVAIFGAVEQLRERLAKASPKLAWIAPALLMAALVRPAPAAASSWSGKLDLSYTDFSAVGAWNYTTGKLMAGTEKPLWLLEHNDSEVGYLAPEYLHEVSGGGNSLGISAGVPLSDAAQLLIGATNKVFTNSGATLPSWSEVAAQAVSIEAGGGYNLLERRAFGTIEAEVKVPLG